LGYELCWIRKGALLIGATPQALSIVVAVFFGGMAAGAYLFGLFSKRAKNTLMWYGIIECTIGLMAATTPMLFELAGDIYSIAYQWAGTSHFLHILFRSALVAALIFPTSLLIGGTLSLLCQFFTNYKHADTCFAAGKLYTINTAGAFLGCMCCGIWLIPLMGVNAAIWLNSLLSVTTGGGIILLSKVVLIPTRNIAIYTPVNNKAKVISHRAYGFRTAKNFILNLYHCMADLIMPTTLHRFV
jgi:spermidine synthase